MPTATRRRRRRKLAWHDAALELKASFAERQLTVYASATAFQILSAMVPFVLFGLALLGFFHFQSVWTDHVAPQIEPHVSTPAFQVINDTVTKVLTHKQVFWVTAGFALAIWQISGAVRVIMRGLDSIYDVDDDRSGRERIVESLLLALAVSVLVLGAIAIVWLTPLAYGNVGAVGGTLLGILRWLLAAVLLGLAVGLIDRFGPDARQPVGWVSFGTGLMVCAWIVASFVFGLYLRFVASPGSIFGALATVVVLIAYVYLSTIVYFTGAQADAIVRRRVEGNARGR